MKKQNLMGQGLSRAEMKNVLGGDLVAMMCPLCIEDPYWYSYAPKDHCVSWHCVQEAPPILVPCPISNPNC